MAGLFSFFGGKKNPGGLPQQKQGAYFLDADSAKTYGDIEYMRSSKVIKHKFPKTASNQAEFEEVETVSAMDKMKGNNGMSPATPVLENGSTAQWQPVAMNGSNSTENGSKSSANGFSENGDRRRTDSSMDMFRNMAKEIRKR